MSGQESPAPVARLREGIRDGSGLWFWDCPACPCAFGPVGSRARAEREAAEHDAECHAGELGYGPKQEYYGFDPDDGFGPPITETAAAADGRTRT